MKIGPGIWLVVWLVVTVCAAAGLAMAQQEVRPTPGPGSGRMTVDVATAPVLQVMPAGEWSVAIGNVPEVRVVNTPTVASALPEFIRKGLRYEITWPDGERETVTVSDSARGGWFRVDAGSRQRWINVAAARSLERLQ